MIAKRNSQGGEILSLVLMIFGLILNGVGIAEHQMGRPWRGVGITITGLMLVAVGYFSLPT